MIWGRGGGQRTKRYCCVGIQGVSKPEQLLGLYKGEEPFLGGGGRGLTLNSLSINTHSVYY